MGRQRGHHRGHETPPVTLDAPCCDGGITYHCKTPLNIEIYPSTLFFFFENIGWSMILWVGGVVPTVMVGWRGMVQLKGNKLFPPNKFIFTYYQYLQELSNQINDGFNWNTHKYLKILPHHPICHNTYQKLDWFFALISGPNSKFELPVSPSILAIGPYKFQWI